VEIRIPKIGVENGDVVIQQWLKSPGEPVHKDEIIAILETDKVVTELSSPGDGVLHVVVTEGQRAKMTEVIGHVLEGSEVKGASMREENHRANPSVRRLAESMGVDLSNIPADKSYRRITRHDVLQAADDAKSPVEDLSDHLVPATPLARALSRQWAVDLGGIEGSGPHQEVLATDVRRVRLTTAPAPPSTDLDSRPSLGGRTPLTPMRQTIARNMMQSLGESAQMTLMGWLDIEPLFKVFQALQEDREYLGVRPSWSAIFVKVLAVGVAANPVLNGRLADQEWVQWGAINIGVAVDTERGLLVPVIREADHKTLVAIHRELAELAAKAREARLSSDEMSEGTVTLSNFGSFGGEWGTPILNRGQTGLLGIGALEKYAAVDRDDRVVVGYRMPYSLTVDHRVVDGAVAGRFIKTLKGVVNRPTRLL
jgi:pyruvate/2-oxoglutarate dehydrogenase complex dihydrolipoamide acyltransferase (E2) component